MHAQQSGFARLQGSRYNSKMAELPEDCRTASATYRTLRRLGKGGMAEIFLARQEGLAGFQRLAVVKRILPQYSADPGVAQMLLDEARIAGQLNHPNIVQIFDLGQKDGQYFIAMEFVDGCDVATLARIERNRQARVPTRLALRIVSEAAMGLDYAHRRVGLDGRPLNLVHRDVSPHNILCSREGAVKLTDFGIVKAAGKEQVTEIGIVKGKIHYMSPEQYTGGQVDARSDIYSLGVVLYQLTTGRLPRVSKSGDVAMRRVLEGTIPRPSEVSPNYPDELERIVMRALSQSPEERYADAASMRDDLLDFARSNDLLAFPKELGSYVDELVPAAPLSKAEASVAAYRPRTEALDPPRRPPTEVVTPAAKPVADSPVERRVSSVAPGAAIVQLAVETPPRGLSLGERLRANVPLSVPVATLSAPAEGHSSTMSTGVRIAEPIRAPRPEVESRQMTASRRRTRPARRHRLRNLTLLILVGVVLVFTGAYVLSELRRQGDGNVAPALRPGAVQSPVAGAISITSVPREASVSVDGAERCPSTPCHISGLPLGRELLVTVRSPGYSLWMQRVVLTTAEPKLIFSARLRALSSAARRRSSSARVRAGRVRARVSSSATSTARAATSAKGPQPKLDRKKDSLVTVSIASDKCMLVVDVRPGWAEVWIDGKKIGHTPMQVALAPGPHAVVLKNAQFKFEKSFKIQARKGKKIKISAVLTRPKA